MPYADPARRRVNPQPVPQSERLDLPPLGVLIVDDDAERLQCHVCGTFWRALGVHVARAHGMAADDYRERFELNRTAPLASPALQERLRVLHTAHLAAIRPAETPVVRGSKQQLAAWTSQPRRLQMRIKHAGDVREHSRRHPSAPKPARERRPPLPIDQRIERANAGRAVRLADPAFREQWRRRISQGRLGVTPEQIEEIRALRGRATYDQIVRRFGVGTRTIARIWRGQL